MSNFNVKKGLTEGERFQRMRFIENFKNCPIPESEIMNNMGLFLNRQLLSRVMFINELYRKIINVHGVIAEFGVRWGQNMALYESFRGMYEPYNYNRKIIGFDTFEGFPKVSPKDGHADFIKKGAYSVTNNYEEYLNQILEYHEKESPISHIKKYQLIKGDATETICSYLEENPETIIALAFFDFDLYEPTKKCLEAIRGHITKGTIIGFDELNCRDFPGETLALKEVFGLGKYKIQRLPFTSLMSYVVIE